MALPIYLDSTVPQRAGLMLALVLALHAGVLALLLSLEVLPLPAPLASLMLRVIPPSRQAEITRPQPKPVMHKVVAQNRPEPAPERPLLAAAAQAPAAAAAPTAKEQAAPLPPAAMPAPPAVVSEPRFDAAYLDNPAPAYPALSRRLREEGLVMLRVFVDAGGRASQVQIKVSSGSPRLDQAAQDAVSHWKFVPAQRGSEAVGAWALVPIVFNLRG